MRGVLLRPEQAAYKQARLLVNQRFDGIRPQAIAHPADVHDVVKCVNFTRTSRIPLALRSRAAAPLHRRGWGRRPAH
ncbi:hypothetical protein [Streptomyces caeruleatus]|nr:hypothetical protein [Streptomyces caeruleatus]